MRLLVAGGGTGGHLYPGIAIAQEWLKQLPQADVLFVVSRRGLEEKVLDKLGFSCRFVSLESVGRAGWVRMPYLLGKSLAESLKIVGEFNPHVLVGVGGFSSVPAAMAGKVLGKPVYVQEQNIYPGRANRIIARFSRKVFISYSDAQKYFPSGRTILSGNPVRTGLKVEKKDYGRFGFSKERFTLLVFGGSQGAHRINRAMIDAAAVLAKVRDRIQVIHVTGRTDLETAQNAYKEIPHHVVDYLMEMEKAYAVADLVVCRAGATTLAEITALGKASILVPYPHAAGDHQNKNADFMVRAGAAVKVDDAELEGNALAGLIADYMDSPDKLREMEDKSAGIGTFEGANKIVSFIREELQDT